MPLLKRAAPFDDPDWIYELKMDGFRALAIVEHGRAQLLSRNGNPFASFSALAESISDSLPNGRAVIDGEICSLDRRGKPQFKNLLFHRGNPPCFFAFDLLTCDGKDLRTEQLLDRKQELRRLLAKTHPHFHCDLQPAVFVVASRAAPEARLSGSRRTSAAREQMTFLK